MGLHGNTNPCILFIQADYAMTQTRYIIINQQLHRDVSTRFHPIGTAFSIIVDFAVFS
jgi:hypothetical protein